MNKVTIMIMLLGCNKLNYKNKTYELHEAVRTLKLVDIELILNKGANVDEKDDNRRTALYIASQKGYKEVAELLLNKGSNVNDKNGGGLTASMIASRNGHKEVVDLLINKGASVNDKNNIGHTVLMAASRNGNKEIVDLLLNKGANVNDKDDVGWTALYIASFNGHKEVAELLLNKGANVNDKDDVGWTALMIASENGYKELAELLLNKGANVNDKNKDNFTALMIAVDYECKEIAELLLNKDADLSIKNNEGKTVVDIAKESSNYEELFSSFKKVARSKINVDALQTWNRALQLLTYFKVEDEDSIYIINKAIEGMTKYYLELEEYNLFNVELAVSRLKNPMLFNYNEEVKQNYVELLKTILIYLARSSNILSNDIETMEEEQKELLNQITYGVSVITEKVNNEVRIKQDLPEDMFHFISTFF